jgi:hypothetical protein
MMRKFMSILSRYDFKRIGPEEEIDDAGPGVYAVAEALPDIVPGKTTYTLVEAGESDTPLEAARRAVMRCQESRGNLWIFLAHISDHARRIEALGELGNTGAYDE